MRDEHSKQLSKLLRWFLCYDILNFSNFGVLINLRQSRQGLLEISGSVWETLHMVHIEIERISGSTFPREGGG